MRMKGSTTSSSLCDSVCVCLSTFGGDMFWKLKKKGGVDR